MSTRDLSHDAPFLFDMPTLTSVPEESAKEEKGPLKTARDFVRWCCSLGADFRNSPDVTNLRYWAEKSKINLKDGEEAEILDAARPLFLKRIEQAVRKAEDPA